LRKLAVVALTLVFSVAAAQAGPTSTSSLTKVPLSGGAIRVTDPEATKEFGAVIRAVAEQAGGTCQQSEYLVWEDPATADAIGNNLTAGFEKAGLEFTEIDSEESDEGNATYFKLSSKSATYAAAWVVTADSIVLGWCSLKTAGGLAKAPAVTKPPAVDAKAPTATAPAAKAPAAKSPAAAPTAPTAKAPAAPAAPAVTVAPVKPKPGFIAGRVLDTQGRPLAGASVYVYGVTYTQGQKVNFETQAGKDGTFSIRVPDGRYRAKATTIQKYGDKTFGFVLYPLSGNPNTEVDSTDGGTLDFQWKLSGLSAYSAAPGSRYSDFYGAGIYFSYCGLPAQAYCGSQYTTIPADVVPGGSKITVTLTPKGPLIDGSSGKAITRTVTAGPIRSDYPPPQGGGRLVLGNDWQYHSTDLLDIPLGRYTMTVIATLPDGSRKPLKLGLKEDDVEHESLDIEWTPWKDYNPGSYTGGGVTEVKVYIRD
jgi:hypothetical protein